MDPFDEFEMKPITDGLGFHKKSIQLKEKSSRLLSDQMAELPSRPIEEKKDSSVLVTQPLPRKPAQKMMDVEIPVPTNKMPPVWDKTPPRTPSPSDPMSQIFQRPQVGTRRGAADSPVSPLEPIPVSWSSAFLDAIVVLAFSLVFLVSLLMVTGVDLLAIVRNAQQEYLTQMSLGLLYLAVLEIYVVLSRSFFGRTLGEWTFECQMGQEDQMKKSNYPMLVLWRSLIVLFTGIFTLPLLSALFRKDILSNLTGLQLYRRRA